MTSAACRRTKTRTNLLLNILLLLQGLLQLSLKITDLSQVLGRLEQQQQSKRKTFSNVWKRLRYNFVVRLNNFISKKKEVPLGILLPRFRQRQIYLADRSIFHQLWKDRAFTSLSFVFGHLHLQLHLKWWRPIFCYHSGPDHCLQRAFNKVENERDSLIWGSVWTLWWRHRPMKLYRLKSQDEDGMFIQGRPEPERSTLYLLFCGLNYLLFRFFLDTPKTKQPAYHESALFSMLLKNKIK